MFRVNFEPVFIVTLGRDSETGSCTSEFLELAPGPSGGGEAVAGEW